jgi:hypothetical protein
MALPSRWMLQLSGHDNARERLLAEASRDREGRALRDGAAEDEVRFRLQSEAAARTPHVTLGADAGGVSYRIGLTELTSLPAWVTAATGAGKSRFVGAFMDAVLRHGARGAPVSLVLVDGKGETADLLLRSVAALAMTQGWPIGFASRLNTFRFFARDFLPSWPFLGRSSGIEIGVQADVAHDAAIGPRQRAMLAAVLAVAIEAGVPMAELPWLLSSPGVVSALAAQSALPSVRLELSRFDREPQGSKDGLVARLGTLLRVPALKAVLSGPAPFDMASCFEPGSITVLDFGGADLGARAGVRAMGSLAISALANAAFDPRRRVRGTTMIVVDEPQALMTSVTLGEFERLITLGRSFGAGGLVVVHQGATQLPQELQSVLNTNVPLRVLGRSSERDASASSEWLPRTGRLPRRREGHGRASSGAVFMSAGEEERARVAELGRLPARHFLVADRRADFTPRVIRAPEYDPPPWSAIDPAVADAVRRGSVGMPRATLEERVREIEARAATRLADERDVPARGRPMPATPPVAGQGARARGRRGEVP